MPAGDSPQLQTELRGAVRIIRINRPEARNALTRPVLAGIGRLMLSADDDPAVRAVILTGTGDQAFCAGMDLRDFNGGQPPSPDDDAGMDAFTVFSRSGIATPVIGAANGTAVAGGFELLLSCDMVVAAAGARFGLPEVKRGLLAAGGGVFLGRRLPLALAYELTLTGDLIDTERALSLGLVNTVVPPGQVLDAALALAERVVANGPLSISATKRLVRAAAYEEPAAVYALQQDLVSTVFGSEDAAEGAAAFIEKRAPQWKGR